MLEGGEGGIKGCVFTLLSPVVQRLDNFVRRISRFQRSQRIPFDAFGEISPMVNVSYTFIVPSFCIRFI